MKTTFKAAIFALALAVSVGASADSYVFNNNLRVGARGADVTALQNVLVAENLLMVNPTGYFGSLTLKAVKAYQLANGLPSTGFVGPMTREVLNRMNSGTTACPAGLVCTPVTTTPVACPAGYTCVSNTSNTSTALQGSEGFAEVRLSPTPTNNTNIQTSSDVSVYGIEFKAKQSDISVERINLQVSVNNNGSMENPSTLINKITVRDGSNILTTIPVNSSTFSKDTSSSTNNIYYVQVTGISTKVAQDTIKTLTFSFDTNSIDTARTVTVGVYGTQGIRTVDGRGISSYNGLTDSRVHTFNKPGNSNLLVKADATTIYAQNYRINTTSNGAEKVLLSTFAVKSETGPSKITSIVATTTASGTSPTNLYLYDGSTILDARSVSGGNSVTFDLNNANIVVAQDQTRTFTIKADMPATTATGTAVKSTVTSVTYEKANGSSVAVSASIAGPFHYFAPVVPQFSKISSTATTIKNNNIDTSVTANVKLGIVAQGGDISATTGEITASIGLKNLATGAILNTSASSTVNGTVESGLSIFADGASKTVEFTANFASSTFSAGTTNVKTFIQSITFKPVGGTAQTLTSGFELLDSDGYASFSK